MVKEPPVYAHAVTRLSLVLSSTIMLGKDLLESAQLLQCWQSGKNGNLHSQDIDQEGSKENQQATVSRGDCVNLAHTAFKIGRGRAAGNSSSGCKAEYSWSGPPRHNQCHETSSSHMQFLGKCTEGKKLQIKLRKHRTELLEGSIPTKYWSCLMSKKPSS